MQFSETPCTQKKRTKAQGKLSFFTLSQKKKKATVNRNYRTSHRSGGSILQYVPVKNTKISQIFNPLYSLY
jgi:hypothetical protein